MIFMERIPSISLLMLMVLTVVLEYAATTDVVQVRGAGASFPSEIYRKWRALYSAKRSVYVRINMTYDSIGSGSGLDQITGRKRFDDPIEYAGSDVPLTEADYAVYPDLQMFPTMAGAIAIAHSVPAISNISLSREVLVGIFNGSIIWWNDSQIQALNGNRLPEFRIIVIARADKSGTTETLTAALSTFSKEWSSSYGTFSEKEKWPSGVISYFGLTTRGVSGLLLSFPYSLTYVSVSELSESKAPSASIINRAGVAVSPLDFDAVQHAMDIKSDQLTSRLTDLLTDSEGERTYPIAAFTYLVIWRTFMNECASAVELVGYVEWFLFDQQAQEECMGLGMVPISKKLALRIRESVLKSMFCKGKRVWTLLEEQRRREAYKEEPWVVPVAVTIPIVVSALMAAFSYLVIQRIRLIRQLNRNVWEIPLQELIFCKPKNDRADKKSRLSRSESTRSRQSISQRSLSSLLSSGSMEVELDFEHVKRILQWPARFHYTMVGLRVVALPNSALLRHSIKKQLVKLREHVSHVNVAKLIGLTTSIDGERYVVSELCLKGPLSSLLRDDKLVFKPVFRFSMAQDVTAGMAYLHHQDIIHGCFRTESCLIDSKWTVKIADWEFLKLSEFLAAQQGDKTSSMHAHLQQLTNSDLADYDEDNRLRRKYWIAPEVLRAEGEKISPTEKGDVYSYAITLYEIFTRRYPYSDVEDSSGPRLILDTIVRHNLRPEYTDDVPVRVRQIMEICWADNAPVRPNFESILKMMRHANPEKRGALDTIIQSMEEYSQSLEEQLADATVNLQTREETLFRCQLEQMPRSLLEKFRLEPALDTIQLSFPLLCLMGIEELEESARFIGARYGLFALCGVTGECFIFPECAMHEKQLDTSLWCGKLLQAAKDLAELPSAHFRAGGDYGFLRCVVTGEVLPRLQLLGSVVDDCRQLALRCEPRTAIFSETFLHYFKEPLNLNPDGSVTLEDDADFLNVSHM